MTKVYAMYRGDEYICDGTLSELAIKRNVQYSTMKYYLYPAYQKKLAKRKRSKRAIALVEIDDE